MFEYIVKKVFLFKHSIPDYEFLLGEAQSAERAMPSPPEGSRVMPPLNCVFFYIYI